MKFQKARIKNPKADLATGDITIAFLVSSDCMEVAQELAVYATENLGTVSLDIFRGQMIPLNFPRATVKSPKADLAKREITISFSVGMEFMETGQALGAFARENLGGITVDIFPRQLPLNGLDRVTLSSGGRTVELRPGGLRANSDTGEVEDKEAGEK